MNDSSEEDLDMPTSVQKVLDDFRTSQRKALVATAKRKVSPVVQRLNFRSHDESIFDQTVTSSPLASSTKRVPLFAQKVPKFTPLGPDPLEGLSTAKRQRFNSSKVVPEAEKKLQEQLDKASADLAAKEAQCITTQAEVTRWKALHDKLEAVRNKDRIECESLEAKYELEKKQWQDQMKLLREQMTQERRRTMNTWQDEQKDIQEKRDRTNELEDEVQQMASENIQLQEKIQELQHDLDANERRSSDSMERHRYRIQELESRVEELQKLSALEEGSAAKIGELNTQLETTRLKLQERDQEVKRLQYELTANEDAVLMRKAMSDKLTKYPELVKDNESLSRENKLLKDTAENAELLKEQVATLTKSLDEHSQLAAEGNRAKADLEMAQTRIQEWQGVVLKLLSSQEAAIAGEAVGPEVLQQKLLSMQKSELLLQQECETLKASVSRLESGQHKSEKSETAQSGTIAGLNKDLEENAKLIRRLQRKLLLVSKERDSLKEVLQSYEKEITFTGAQFEQDRVSSLEKIITDHKDMIDRLETQVANCATGGTVTGGTVTGATLDQMDVAAATESLQNQVDQLRAALAKEEKAKEDLQLELDRRSIRGDFDPTTTKVLHFANNPTAQAIEGREQAMGSLQSENEALKARVKLLEEGQTKDLTLMVDQRLEAGTSSKEVQELKDQVAAAAVQKQRILDAFKKTSQEFREVCWQLTGYRIDGLANRQYRLTPTFADNPSDHLLFQRTADGECQLLETPFSRTVRELIDLHLGRQRSIPVFLAGLIMDLFSRSTFDTVDDDDDDDDDDEEEEGEEEEEDEENNDEDDDQEPEEESMEDDQPQGMAEAGDEDEPICLD